MGCESCSSGGTPGGCKNNGACGVSGCNKLEVFDWLSGMELPTGQKPFNIIEVRFKNDRKAFFRISLEDDWNIGDVVTVESSPGHDVGIVSLTGELVRIQMRKKEVKDNHEIRRVMRAASEADIATWQEARQMEWDTMIAARTISKDLNLTMKISDVEYQGDKVKATFYYTAEGRVDFRELIKSMADKFRVRIEMRQIGMRQEAGKLGGIGSCGRELCCSSWLTDFRTVSTSSARYQQLALNPQKLAGQCGKLKCCLNFELDQYMEAIRDFPSPNTKLESKKAIAFHFKTDIFKRVMYFIYERPVGGSPICISVDDVKEIVAMNKDGKMPEDLEYFAEVEEIVIEETDYGNVVGQDSLTRFDKAKKSRGKKRRSPDGGSKGATGDKPRSKRGPKKGPQAKGDGSKKGPQRESDGSKNAPRDKTPGENKGGPSNKGKSPNSRRRKKPNSDAEGDNKDTNSNKPSSPQS
jgi:cell fate regulator YaaT (PSP1 superfamily)